MLDDHSELEPPDPIPNSEVKRLSADGSVGFPHVRVGHRQALNPKTPCRIPAGGFSFTILTQSLPTLFVPTSLNSLFSFNLFNLISPARTNTHIELFISYFIPLTLSHSDMADTRHGQCPT